MPNPKPGETEREFLSRCIPELVKDEYYEQKQAIAVCYSKYRKEGTEKKSPKPERKSKNPGKKSKKLNLSPNTKRKVIMASYY